MRDGGSKGCRMRPLQKDCQMVAVMGRKSDVTYEVTIEGLRDDDSDGIVIGGGGGGEYLNAATITQKELFFQKRLNAAIRKRIQDGGIVAVVG